MLQCQVCQVCVVVFCVCSCYSVHATVTVCSVSCLPGFYANSLMESDSSAFAIHQPLVCRVLKSTLETFGWNRASGAPAGPAAPATLPCPGAERHLYRLTGLAPARCVDAVMSMLRGMGVPFESNRDYNAFAKGARDSVTAWTLAHPGECTIDTVIHALIAVTGTFSTEVQVVSLAKLANIDAAASRLHYDKARALAAIQPPCHVRLAQLHSPLHSPSQASQQVPSVPSSSGSSSVQRASSADSYGRASASSQMAVPRLTRRLSGGSSSNSNTILLSLTQTSSGANLLHMPPLDNIIVPFASSAKFAAVFQKQEPC